MRTAGLSLEERLMARGVLADVAQVCTDTGVSLSAILGRGRTKSVAAARHEAMRAMRRRGLSYPEIGWLFGRDHTTVLMACRKG